MLLKQIQTYSEIAQSILTSFAVLFGGWWAWRRFIRTRAKYPRVRMGHSIYHSPIDDTWRLIRVSLRIDNQSEVLIRPGEIEVRILQIRPWPDEVKEILGVEPRPDEILDHMKMIQENESEFRWRYVARRIIQPKNVEIEPNESEEYHFDFIVSDNLESVAVYTFVKNIRKQPKDIGWQLTTIHDLGRGGGTNERRGTSEAV